MIDSCEILINTHFQFKGEKWEFSHEVAWRLQESLNDSYCFSMDKKLVIQTQNKIELVWCNFFWSKKKPPTEQFSLLRISHESFPMNMFTMVYCDTYLTSFASSYLAPQLVSFIIACSYYCQF